MTAEELENLIQTFDGLTEAYTLEEVLEFVWKGNTVRFEVFRNDRSRFSVRCYQKQGNAWLISENFPWVDQDSKEIAVRNALGFLTR